MQEDNIKKLKLFIINNDLDFNDDGSSLNSTCCIISGYALHIGANLSDLEEAIDSLVPSPNCWNELERVFEFAEKNDYGSYWTSEDAKASYKF